MTNPKDQPRSPAPKKQRRRATAPGTGPASADGPEPRLDELKPAAPQQDGRKQRGDKLTERDRWLLAEKPPHY